MKCLCLHLWMLSSCSIKSITSATVAVCDTAALVGNRNDISALYSY